MDNRTKKEKVNYELRKYGGLQNHSGRIPRTDIAGGTYDHQRNDTGNLILTIYPKGAVDFFSHTIMTQEFVRI